MHTIRVELLDFLDGLGVETSTKSETIASFLKGYLDGTNLDDVFRLKLTEVIRNRRDDLDRDSSRLEV